jgi:diaminopimelate decarboxylase
MIELFPAGTSIENGVLQLAGLKATELADRFGTPLVVYSEEALRERARMFRRAVPDALVV